MCYNFIQTISDVPNLRKPNKMNPLTQIYQETQSLPLAQQVEILHFIEFLKQRQTTTVQRNWQTVFQITQQFSEDFMADGRKQPAIQTRETF